MSASFSRKDEKSQAAVKKCVDPFLEETGWQPAIIRATGGALMYMKYSFLVRTVMKKISAMNGGPTDTSQDHELTVWVELKDFPDQFLIQQVLRLRRLG